ncbi:MAG: metallophosphoesterase [Wenzhouxiangellaceae bacterium]|nr:metallophosphoesterase [Wenzhouxiangellaceae bacterium]
MSAFRIVHLTDVHIPPLPTLRLRELFGKRLLGLRSWHRKWKQEHRPEILAALDRALAEIAPEHICVTGDLTFTTHPAEVEQARAWLASLGPAERISLVPGNHDAYVPGALEHALERWADWMRDDAGGPVRFPYLQRRGPVDIIGLSTAIPLRLPITVGRIGRDQLERLRALLDQTAGDGRPRIVLLHHPPQDGVARWSKQLLDRAQLQRMIAGRRVELMLHGHLHRPLETTLAGTPGPVTVLGSGSVSALGNRYHPAHFRIIEFDPAWQAGAFRQRHAQYNGELGSFEIGKLQPLATTA